MRLPFGRRVGSASWPELAAVHEGLQNVLLDGEIAIGDRAHRRSELRQGVDGFGDPEVGDIVRGRFRAQQQVVPDVLLDGAVTVVTPDDGIRQIEIFDDRFELAAMARGDLATEDGREFGGLADGAVGVEEALAERVKGGAAVKDQVVAILDLREK